MIYLVIIYEFMYKFDNERLCILRKFNFQKNNYMIVLVRKKYEHINKHIS